MKVISVWAILLAGFMPARAQTLEAGALHVESKVELKGGDDPAADESTWTADLEYLIRHPINIANASPDKLRGCGLFSEMQVAGILNHRQKFGDLISVEELQRVSGFSESVVRSLLPYIICETTVWSGKSVADVFAEGEHYLLYRVGRVVEEKQGHAYGQYSAYKGSPFSSLIRYRYAYRNSLSVNITAEKDPGEEFFTGSNKKGFDFYSASIALMNHKWLKALVAGDYQVSYGQGLVMGSAPGGFSGDPVFSKRNFSGIRPYKSSAESGFQRGVALSAGTRNGWTSDLFFSAVKLDGNLRSAEDSLYEVNSVSSFQSSGYHRTWSEILDKGVVSEKIGGARLAKVGSSFGAGVTAVNVSYSNRFEKTNQPYNQFDFAGRSFARYGSDFWLLFRNLILYGEVAFSSSFNPAFAGGVMVSADKNLLFSGSVRKYPRDHVAMLSSGPGQRSANANEEGASVSALLNFTRSLKVSGMFDLYRFPWLVYDNNTLVNGNENSVQFTWSPARKFEFYLRWRYESFSSTAADPDRKLDRTQVLYRKGIRAHGTYQLTDQLSAKTRMEWVSGTTSGELNKGVMFFQDLNWKPLESRWELSLRYAIFETDGYDARIYAYETDVPGSYSVPAYYYKGSRYYIMIRFKSSSSLSCWLKYGAFVYTNRNSVGSGYEEIPGNKKSEVKLQIRYEFE